MLFIGDVHGKWVKYLEILKAERGPTIQVGDLGVGFPEMSEEDESPLKEAFSLGGHHRFIRGNHDNPSTCKYLTNWIPDGHFEDGMMFLGGAFSVDRHLRVEGFDIWHDEELSMFELYAQIQLYEERKPEIMVTHDAPSLVSQALFGRDGNSRTNEALQAMFSSHQPDLWIFGHHHQSVDHKIGNTRFICLDELETFRI